MLYCWLNQQFAPFHHQDYVYKRWKTYTNKSKGKKCKRSLLCWWKITYCKPFDPTCGTEMHVKLCLIYSKGWQELAERQKIVGCWLTVKPTYWWLVKDADIFKAADLFNWHWYHHRKRNKRPPPPRPESGGAMLVAFLVLLFYLR